MGEREIRTLAHAHAHAHVHTHKPACSCAIVLVLFKIIPSNSSGEKVWIWRQTGPQAPSHITHSLHISHSPCTPSNITHTILTHPHMSHTSQLTHLKAQSHVLSPFPNCEMGIAFDTMSLLGFQTVDKSHSLHADRHSPAASRHACDATESKYNRK